MKKTLVILPIIAGAIFLGGCANKSEAPSVPMGNSVAPEAATQSAPKDNSIAGSLKDMVGMGKRMQCVSNTNGVETKIFIEGKKYKSITNSQEMNMTGIFDGDTFYSWNGKTKAGMKMTAACMEEIGKNMPKNEADENGIGLDSTDKLIEEKSKDNCTEATEPVDFTIPTDVSFVDQCAMMQGVTKNLKDMKLPTDVNLPGSANLPVRE